MTQYTKPIININSESQVNSFSHPTSDESNPQTYDKAYWKYKECYNFHQKGHKSSHCPNNKKKKDDYNKNPKSRKESKASITNMYKYMKKSKNTFTTLQSKISDLKEDKSDLSNSGVESQEDSFFLLKDNYQGMETKYNTAKHTLLYNYRKNISIKKIHTRGQWSSLTMILPWTYSTTQTWLKIYKCE